MFFIFILNIPVVEILGVKNKVKNSLEWLRVYVLDKECFLFIIIIIIIIIIAKQQLPRNFRS